MSAQRSVSRTRGRPGADDADWLARRSEADRPGLKGILDVALEYVVELLRVADEYLVAIETILRSRETRPPQHRSSHPHRAGYFRRSEARRNGRPTRISGVSRACAGLARSLSGGYAAVEREQRLRGPDRP